MTDVLRSFFIKKLNLRITSNHLGSINFFIIGVSSAEKRLRKIFSEQIGLKQDS